MMDPINPPASFTAVPSKTGISWQVIIEIDPDRVQYIGAFESENAAREWISRHSRDWLKTLFNGFS